MISMLHIQNATLHDPRRLLIEGEVRSGEIEVGQRVFLRRRKFVIDAITIGRELGAQKAKAGSRCELILKSVMPQPVPPEYVRYAQGQVVQVL